MNLIHLEDDANDAELVAEALADAGLAVRVERATDRASLERVLGRVEPDAVLLDGNVPGVSGAGALDLAQAMRPGVPVIFVSGSLGDQQAVDLLKRGATDFVEKQNLPRLGLAVRRAIEEARERRRKADAEERYRRIVDTSPDAVISIDAAGFIAEWSLQAERTFGWSRDEARGRRLSELIIPERFRAGHEEALKRLAGGGEPRLAGKRLDLPALRRDGREFPVEITVWPMPSASGPAFSAFVRDVTEKRRLEEQFLQAQKMEAVGRLAGGVAHDFNNLLTVILGYGEMAVGDMAAEDPQRPRVEQMIEAAERAMRVTRQLLAFSRKRVTQERPLDLNATVTGMGRMLERLVGEEVVLEVETSPEPAWVHGDPGQIEQVIVNLVVNGRDAMPRGGRLRVRTEVADRAAGNVADRDEKRPGDFVALSVRDTGVGMEPGVRARIFEPFYTTKGPEQGTGLGLSTVLGIVKAMAGLIQVETAPGKGSEFRVSLPRCEAAAATSLPPATRSLGKRPKGTILLAEDADVVRKLALEVLGRAGFPVLAARDGLEAVEVFHGNAAEISLLLTDNVMPGLTGVELAARLRQAKPELKVVFMSGYVDRGIEALERPGTAFLEKPFTAEMLLGKIREVLA